MSPSKAVEFVLLCTPTQCDGADVQQLGRRSQQKHGIVGERGCQRHHSLFFQQRGKISQGNGEMSHPSNNREIQIVSPKSNERIPALSTMDEESGQNPWDENGRESARRK